MKKFIFPPTDYILIYDLINIKNIDCLIHQKQKNRNLQLYLVFIYTACKISVTGIVDIVRNYCCLAFVE